MRISIDIRMCHIRTDRSLNSIRSRTQCNRYMLIVAVLTSVGDTRASIRRFAYDRMRSHTSKEVTIEEFIVLLSYVATFTAQLPATVCRLRVLYFTLSAIFGWCSTERDIRRSYDAIRWTHVQVKRLQQPRATSRNAWMNFQWIQFSSVDRPTIIFASDNWFAYTHETRFTIRADMV